MVSKDVEHHVYLRYTRAQDLVKAEVAVPNSPYSLCGRKATLNLNSAFSELRSCVKDEVAVLGSPSLTVRTVSVDVMRH